MIAEGSSVQRDGQLALRLRERAHYFQEGAHLLWGTGVCKRYYTCNGSHLYFCFKNVIHTVSTASTIALQPASFFLSGYNPVYVVML